MEEKDDSPEGRDTEKAALSQALLKMYGMAAGPRGPLGCPTPWNSYLPFCYMKHTVESKSILALSHTTDSEMGISMAALLFAEPHSISLEAEVLPLLCSWLSPCPSQGI